MRLVWILLALPAEGPKPNINLIKMILLPSSASTAVLYFKVHVQSSLTLKHSIKGFERLFQRAGLANVEVTTPGHLDVDIVRNACKGDPELLQGQRFLKNLLANDSSATAFQNFLVEQRRSSHAWMIGQR